MVEEQPGRPPEMRVQDKGDRGVVAAEQLLERIPEDDV